MTRELFQNFVVLQAGAEMSFNWALHRSATTLSPPPTDELNNTDYELYTIKLMTGSLEPKACLFLWEPKPNPPGSIQQKN